MMVFTECGVCVLHFTYILAFVFCHFFRFDKTMTRSYNLMFMCFLFINIFLDNHCDLYLSKSTRSHWVGATRPRGDGPASLHGAQLDVHRAGQWHGGCEHFLFPGLGDGSLYLAPGYGWEDHPGNFTDMGFLGSLKI